MWPFKSKEHLRYESVAAWVEGEKIPTPATSIKDTKLRDELFTKLGELRQHLFDKHLERLSETEQEQLKAGKHASQSHEHIEVAKTIAELLAAELSHNKFVTDVSPSFYHMNRIVLIVLVDCEASVNLATKAVPQFFRGFEVKVSFKK